MRVRYSLRTSASSQVASFANCSRRSQTGLVVDLAAEDPERGRATAGVFVGRERELAELFAGLEDAFAGRDVSSSSQASLVSQDPADRGADRARAPSAAPLSSSVAVGRRAAHRLLALGAGAACLRPRCRPSRPARGARRRGGGSRADRARASSSVPGSTEVPASESEGARFRLFDATTEFLRNVSRRSPLLLVLDDLHAADAPSTSSLAILGTPDRLDPNVDLGALRNVDPVSRPSAARDAARDHPRAGNAPPDDRRAEPIGVCQAVRRGDCLGDRSPQLVADLHDETEGNPLFVAEMVRLLALEGSPPGTATTRTGRAGGHSRCYLATPRSPIRDCNRVLTLAAILGVSSASRPRQLPQLPRTPARDPR